MSDLVKPTPAKLALENVLLNDLEAQLASMPPVAHPEVHTFIRGQDGKVNLYCRQIFLKAGIACTSKIHKTQHQYCVTKGKLRVWTEGKGWVEITAPYFGMTYPGARRALAIIEDTTWTTFHPTTCETVEEWEAQSIEHDERLEVLRRQQATNFGQIP